MLSRVAEEIYWMARYIERAEDTARLINSTTNLLLDLPRSVKIGWGTLLQIMSLTEPYQHRHGDKVDEHAVMSYLISDMANPSSLLMCVMHARENARVTRAIVPTEAWEQINALFLYTKQHADQISARRARYDFLHNIVLRCQTITGILAGCMPQGVGYAFIRLGRNLERADMTSRILDIGAAGLLEGAEEHRGAFGTVRWMNIMKSLSAYQAYRHAGHIGMRGREVVEYLLCEPLFPRSVRHCLDEISGCLVALPNHASAALAATELTRDLDERDFDQLTSQQAHQLIDEIQIGLGRIHERVTHSYFRTILSA